MKVSIALLFAFLLSVPTAQAGDRACPAFQTLSSTVETPLTDVRKFSNPWAAWLKVDSGTVVATVNGYGSCLDTTNVCIGGANSGATCTSATVCPAGTCGCPRPGPYILGTLTSATVCNGGANDGVACTVVSECPGGACVARRQVRGEGPIEAVTFTATTCVGTCGRVQFCGTSAGGVQ